MKLEASKVEVLSNMQFDESVEMGIGHDAIPMVIERLISAYNNPARAVLREYTSNAFDVHVEHGITRPVEVSLPDALTPSLSVRDYGIGLSRDELKGFGQFGESTKRNSNELTGGFGLGSKSGLAVASQFTVMSIKNGRRNTVVVARDEDNRPHMNFLAEAETDEPSGTTITIPISSRSSLGGLDDFFVGWAPNSITIDGDAPKRSVYSPDQFRSLKGIAWYDLSGETSPRDGIRVLINQVYYVLNYKDMGLTHTEWGNLKNYVIKLDNGSVKIAPSREDLIYNTPTKATIRARIDEVLSIASEVMASSVSSAATAREALLACGRMKYAGYPVDNVFWGGTRILLPGMTFQGNRIPNAYGTWAKPSYSANTKTGLMVERKRGVITSYDLYATYSQYRKLVIIHSAGEAVEHASSSSSVKRVLHKESFAVADWLSGVDDVDKNRYEIFITSEPLSRVNRWYREAATVLLHVDEFNLKAKRVRDERLAQERADAKARRKTSKLKVLTSSSWGVPTMLMLSIEDISSKFEHTILLRNMDTSIAGSFRNSLLTKANYTSHISSTGLSLARGSKSALIVLNKSDDISDAMELLPPETTFGEVAAKLVKDSVHVKTVYESMAVRDRPILNMTVFRSLGHNDMANIGSKETRKWIEAILDYQDEGSEVRDGLSWMRPYAPEVNDAFLEIYGKTESSAPLPVSPIKRYPLLKHGVSYQTKSEDIVHYINLCDADAGVI